MLRACPLSVPVPDCLSFNPLQRPVIWCAGFVCLLSVKQGISGRPCSCNHVWPWCIGAGVARVNFALGSL